MGKITIQKYLNIASFILGAVFFLSCSNNSIKEWNELTETTRPDIIGYNIEIIHSNNANVKFRLKAPKVIEKYKNNKPYIYLCPNGIKLWQYDNNMKLNFTLVADSAFIIQSKEYYELWGNVTLEREQDSTLVKTEKFIIDKPNNIAFADTPLVINKYGQLKDAIAQGFSSDLEFNKPKFIELTQGEINYDRFKLKSATKEIDSLDQASTQQQSEEIKKLDDGNKILHE